MERTRKNSAELFVPVLVTVFGVLAIICFILGFNQPYNNKNSTAIKIISEIISGAKIFALVLGIVAIIAIIAYFWCNQTVKNASVKKLIFIAGLAVLGISMFLFFVALPIKANLTNIPIINIRRILAFFMFAVIMSQVVILIIANFFKPDSSAKLNLIASILNYVYLVMALVFSHNFFAPRYDFGGTKVFITMQTGALFLNFVFTFAFFATSVFLKAQPTPENEKRSFINIGELGILSFVLPLFLYATFDYTFIADLRGYAFISAQAISATVLIGACIVASIAVVNQISAERILIIFALIIAIAVPIVLSVAYPFISQIKPDTTYIVRALIIDLFVALVAGAGLFYKRIITAKLNKI